MNVSPSAWLKSEKSVTENVVALKMSEQEGRWGLAAAKSWDKRPYICQDVEEGAYGPNYKLTLGWQDRHGLQLYFMFENVTQVEAIAFCKEKGGRVYEPRRKDQFEMGILMGHMA